MQFPSHTAPLSSNPGIPLGIPSDPPAGQKSALKTLSPFDKTLLVQKSVVLLKHTYSGKWLKPC